MKKILTLTLLFVFALSIKNAEAQEQQQENEKYRIIGGVRVNPLIVYDLQGNTSEFVRLHAEVGALFHKKAYISFGYTAAANAVYNFNEYWFVGFDKKVPVSWVVATEYMINDKKFLFQTGPNIKLSNVGNLFVFAFTPTNNFDLGLKVGVFIPLNVVIAKK